MKAKTQWNGCPLKVPVLLNSPTVLLRIGPDSSAQQLPARILEPPLRLSNILAMTQTCNVDLQVVVNKVMDVKDFDKKDSSKGAKCTIVVSDDSVLPSGKHAEAALSVWDGHTLSFQ